MKLEKHYTPVWEVIENFRYFLAIRDKINYSDKQIAVILKMSSRTIAKYKFDNSASFLSSLSVYCIEKDIDIRQFCKYSNSIIISTK